MGIRDEHDHRHELGAFLRAHRELLAPEDIGLPRSPRRRTPGLRREEVAALSGVGVAWYTWLEQGRVDTSRQVLEAVARTLRLDADAHRHVLELAGFHVPAGPGPMPVDALRAMVEGWPISPALVLDPALDLVAWNHAWRLIAPDPAELPTERRNLLSMLLTDPAYRVHFPAHETIALDLVRHLRTRAEQPRGAEIAAELRSARPDLAPWWDCRAVGVFAPRTVATRPIRGVSPRFAMSLLTPAEAPDATVLVGTPVDAETIAHMAGRAGTEAGFGGHAVLEVRSLER
ncbi:helix-turn-helix transcriptional regulator [Embleya sp. NPDC055664]